MHVQLPELVEVLKLTEPLNPPALLTVIVEFADDPAGIVRVWGFAEMVKPRTIAMTFTCRAPIPDPPVTTIV
jgi:hypothetical protein